MLDKNKMKFEIQNWEKIKSKYERGTILLGNGSSIAIHSGFNYSSLLELASQKGLITQEIEDIFESLKTKDFELILRKILQAYHINKALQISEQKTEDAYNLVKNCLIESVNNTHPDFSSIKDLILKISGFLKIFNTVLSLNYDLIIYWSIMAGNAEYPNLFKDCFLSGKFNDDIKMFRQPHGKNKTATLVFYPHGHLALATSLDSSEIKISSNDENILIAEIVKCWNEYKISPLFVSEGTAQDKINTIQRSHYLRTVYNKVIPSLNKSLIIYGFGFGRQDIHILEAFQNTFNNIAVSVYNGMKNQEDYCIKAAKLLRDKFPSSKIDFFDSCSKNCWIY